MTASVGFNGALKIGANVVAEIGEWTLTADSAMHDVTKLGDGWKDQIQGIRTWSGKGVGRWDMTDVNGQVAVQNAYMNATTLVVNLVPIVGHVYTGTVYIKNLNIKDPVGGTVDFDFSFDGTAALTYS